MCQPCCRICSGIHSNNDELVAGSWCCTESEMASSPYPLQLTLNQFPSAPEGSKRDMCRFSATQAHATFFPSAIRLWNTLSVDVCQILHDTCKTHLNSFRFIWAPLLGGTQLLPRVGGLLRPGGSFCPSIALDRPGKQFFSVCISVCFRLSNDYVRDFHQILHAAQKIMWSDQCLLFARQTGSKFPVLELCEFRFWQF